MAHFVEFNKVRLACDDELLAQSRFAVEDISLRVRQGEFIAIVDPSGCACHRKEASASTDSPSPAR